MKFNIHIYSKKKKKKLRQHKNLDLETSQCKIQETLNFKDVLRNKPNFPIFSPNLNPLNILHIISKTKLHTKYI